MRFHCAGNPNFSLSAPAYGVSLRFTDGYYETEDKEEIRLLQRQPAVEVADQAEFAQGGVVPRRDDLPPVLLDSGSVITPTRAADVEVIDE